MDFAAMHLGYMLDCIYVAIGDLKGRSADS
jgi:hypothetical protein